MASSKPKNFPLVGIGASAGGLESFKRFLGAIPENSGMAYILVQHLSPSHESILPKILSRTTKIPVQEITNDCQISPDHIYVIPENKMLEVTDHALRLGPRKQGEQNMPIDVFFNSLARVHGSLASGIVLSGTARDGTAGLRNIKELGGITMAEDPDSAAWVGMPKNAVEAGVVDFILRPEQMPAKLVEVHAAYGKKKFQKNEDEQKFDDAVLKRIFYFVRQKTGADFSYYKKPTILRRIDRRMAINQISNHKDYLEYLRENTVEQEYLFQDLLIKVTSFFRDQEIFDEVSTTVIPKILENRSIDDPIRFWIVGCATGEEAYSLAICLFDAMKKHNNGKDQKRARVQLFASDISESAIKRARSGVYSSTELQPLSEKQIADYFSKTDGHFKVVKSVRDSIVFTVHNFLRDPPFGKVDLISCRNVFIYLEPFLQGKALTTFHYALRENGYLLLGKSETTGQPMKLFTPFSKKGKIFSRKDGEGRFFQEPLEKEKTEKVTLPKADITHTPKKLDFVQSADEILVAAYTPSNVIVDEHWEIVHINGDITPFMGPTQGKPTHQLLKTVRKELAFELRNLLHQVKSSKEKNWKKGIPLNIHDEQNVIDLEIVPLHETIDPYYLVIFRKSKPDGSFLGKIWHKLEPILTPSKETPLLKENAALKKELEQSREDMRGISEEQEAYNEELQSANEELLSNNEEMQSLNEELETSKEELQSTNEELVVVNRELLEKQEELNDTIDDLDEVIASMREPFLVLDRDFRILRANSAYYREFEGDRAEIEGKQFFEIQEGQWNHPELVGLLKNVLPKNQKIINKELLIDFGTPNEHIFLFNAREILRKSESDKRILLAIADITKRKKVEKDYLNTIEELGRTNEQLDQFVHVASHDLQEPLRKIMTFVNRITEGRAKLSEDDLEAYLNKIQSSSSRMSALIKNMLNYARLKDPGQLYERTDLNTVMADIIKDFELLIEQKGAELHIGELPALDAMPLQINQLFYNLISNALKFSSEGVSPIISISSRKLTEKEVDEHPALHSKSKHHEIIVRDNGIGISPEYKEKIFNIFQRLNPSSQYLGTGIGLAICKEIVQNHQGTIFALSKEGEGTAFHVVLPSRRHASENRS